jgi:hypothetical protein
MTRSRLAPLVAPVSLALTGAAVAVYRIDRAAADSTLALALLGAAVLAALAVGARDRDWIVPGTAAAIAAALAFLPATTPLPAAATSALLVVAIGRAASARWARAGAPTTAAIAAVALAVELLARGDQLLATPLAWAPWAQVLAVPILLGATLAPLARRRPAAALALALGTAAAGPGWGWTGAVAVAGGGLAALRLDRAGRAGAGALVVVGAVALPAALAGPAWLALTLAAAAAATLALSRPLARAGAAALAGAALAALAAGSLPWCARPPLAGALESALASPFGVLEQPVGPEAVMLTAERPRQALALPTSVAGARFLDVRSYLVDGAMLPCGTVVARLELGAGGAPAGQLELVAGRDTADWAARRPDVVAAAPCPAPSPVLSWVPAARGFLGSTYRARFALPAGTAIDRIELERDRELPRGVGVAIFWLGVER